MIRDRGTIKWTAMMLPEHVESVKEAMREEEKETQPILDEDKIQEMEQLLLEGMEYNLFLQYHFFKNGSVKQLSGRTIYIDPMKKELRIQDRHDYTHYIPFHTLVNIQND
ncbi:YolD-like family protein [Bacillus sp. B1-b2]|uniref:YolD-like family protein n=1 Tax=Bacillus sp. B1-b2 TaxID=2653201 RepID=UPI0012622C17|nr:YolD-like family protein [Bacillus sp. B1-b2]KAB7672013.1 YolD-like family protein [Bacillus sp. B1-b2]